jgi:predicted O-methyltransferase YrrM
LDTSREYYAFYPLEHLRSLLKKDQTIIQINDFGAGSKYNNKAIKKVKEIARSALSRKWQCRVLFNLVNHFGSHNILELGTSLGLSSAYIAKANQSASIISIEGDPAIAALATKNLKMLNIDNVKVVNGRFETELAKLNDQTFDLVFIDGNHRETSTVDYFNQIKPLLSPNGVFIIDDIHWSLGMSKAWETIKSDAAFNCKIDLFHFGIVLNNSDLIEPLDISLIDFKYKAFDLGFFSKEKLG